MQNYRKNRDSKYIKFLMLIRKHLALHPDSDILEIFKAAHSSGELEAGEYKALESSAKYMVDKHYIRATSIKPLIDSPVPYKYRLVSTYGGLL